MSILFVDDVRGKTTAGSVKMPAGHVIQTVSGTYDVGSSTTSTSPVQAWTGVSITPKFSTSLIKVECNWYCMHRDYYDGYAQIYRNGTGVTNQRKMIRHVGHMNSMSAPIDNSGNSIWMCPAWLWSFTEAAGGTSQITYSIYCWTQNASQPTWWNAAANNSNEDPISTMILSEIAQ